MYTSINFGGRIFSKFENPEETRAGEISPIFYCRTIASQTRLAGVIRICNKDDVVQRYGACNCEAIQPIIRDVVVDLKYRGDYISETRRKIQKAVADNDLAAFTTAMRDDNYWMGEMNVPEDRFCRRCKYITA